MTLLSDSIDVITMIRMFTKPRWKKFHQAVAARAHTSSERRLSASIIAMANEGHEEALAFMREYPVALVKRRLHIEDSQ